MSKQLVLIVLLFVWAPAFALRIVSLLPSNTEIVEALGAGDELVGVTSFDPLPKGSRRVSVGNLLDPQWEVLVSLHPDLVLAGRWSSSPAGRRLQALHIPLVEIDHPQTMNDLYASIQQIAVAIHRTPEQADVVISSMKARLAALAKIHAGRPLIATYIEIDPPTWTIGAKDYLSEALQSIGLDNAFRTVPRLSLQVSAESIIEKNPHVIISLQATSAAIRQRPGWSSITAVQNGWIIDDVNADDLVRPSPRLVDGLTQVDARLKAKGLP
jgi:ABC-type Fe3+-hydroxamate transport system substrate-binding protein